MDRARHLVMGAAAAVIMFCGGVLLGGAVEAYTSWLSALGAPPPPYRALGEGALRHQGLAGEIAVRAQIDSRRAYFVSAGGRDSFAAALYPPEARRASNPVSAVLLEPAGAPAEADFANWVRAVGPKAVVIEFLGRRTTPDPAVRRRIAEALAAEGLRLSPEAAFIDPHHLPRNIELAPNSFGMGFGAAVIGVGALMGLLTLRSMERQHRRKTRRARREAAKTARAARKNARHSSKNLGDGRKRGAAPEASAPKASTPEASTLKASSRPKISITGVGEGDDGRAAPPRSAKPVPTEKTKT